MRKIRFSMVCFTVLGFLVISGCTGQKNIISRKVVFSADKTDTVKVMTFNVRTATAWWDALNSWDYRKQMVIDLIANNYPGIIGLQEALDYQLQEIQTGLSQYSKYGVGRQDGMRNGEMCAILYRKDRFVRLDSGTFWFSDTPDVPGSKYALSIWPRICSWVHLKDKNTNKSFYVYNVHLHAFSQEYRAKSVRLLARRIAIRETDDPFVVTGDFNMEEDNSAMQYLKNLGNQRPYPQMKDAWSSANPHVEASGTTHSFTGWARRKIDHIPISKNIQALDVKVVQYGKKGRYPSDHFPVIATLRLF